MEKKKTAVQYLVKEFSEILDLIKTTPVQDLLIVDAVNKALAMEREQIEEAYEEGEISFHKSGKDDGQYSKTPQQYYNQTFKP